nr:MAG TPA: hypothetical protein [Caudoviricetes sp.]
MRFHADALRRLSWMVLDQRKKASWHSQKAAYLYRNQMVL